MRIIIEVEGEDITVRTEQTEKQTAHLSDTPPRELLRAAAAFGAASAGPAPSAAGLTELATELSSPAIEALPAEPVDAGAGPFPPPGRVAPDAEEQDPRS
jgi:hypothetical protein